MLVAPARAAAGPSGHIRTAAPSAPVIDPGELQQLLDQIVAAGAPGAAALVRDGHSVQRAASGVTKPFVATVVLQLVAEGRLSLSDTVESWLPGILPYGGQVTIRQLLNHTSGVPDSPVPLIELFTSRQGGSGPGPHRSWSPWSPASPRCSRRAPPSRIPTTTTCWPASSSRRPPAEPWAES
jgi:CubicO group peptidase (beta-lactamase class C family)